MSCQNCLAVESPTMALYYMQRCSFKCRIHHISVLDFYKQTYALKIEDGGHARICRTCLDGLCREFYKQIGGMSGRPEDEVEICLDAPTVSYYDMTQLLCLPAYLKDQRVNSTPPQPLKGRLSGESPEARMRRLEDNKTRMKLKRATETPEERANRLEANKLRIAFKRAHESPEDRQKRLSNGKMRARIKRITETPEERMKRLEENKLRVAARRATESPEERALRLEKLKLRMQIKRATETPEERARRLEQSKMREKMRRELKHVQ